MAGQEGLERGGGIVLLSRQVAVLTDPDVDLRYIDLLHGLGNQKRYGGQLEVSVLHHLAICGLLAPLLYPGDAHVLRYAVAHDVHEAYFPDQIRPLKKLVPELEHLEKPWEAWVHERLGLDYPLPGPLERAVKHIDDRAVAVEVWTWDHPCKEWFFPLHGGRPTEAEKEIGRMVCRQRAHDLYRLMRSYLPALPAPGN